MDTNIHAAKKAMKVEATQTLQNLLFDIEQLKNLLEEGDGLDNPCATEQAEQLSSKINDRREHMDRVIEAWKTLRALTTQA